MRIQDLPSLRAKANKRGKNTGPKEQDITKAIIDALSAKRIWCWRNNSGAMPIGEGKSRRFIRMSPKGSPDIFGVLSNGRFFGLEVKTKIGKQSAAQEAWGQRMVDNGAKYDVVRSASEAFSAVMEWEKAT